MNPRTARTRVAKRLSTAHRTAVVELGGRTRQAAAAVVALRTDLEALNGALESSTLATQIESLRVLEEATEDRATWIEDELPQIDTAAADVIAAEDLVIVIELVNARIASIEARGKELVELGGAYLEAVTFEDFRDLGSAAIARAEARLKALSTQLDTLTKGPDTLSEKLAELMGEVEQLDDEDT